MKPCPFCAEEIQDQAIKCKHCGEALRGGPTTAQGPAKRLTRSSRDAMFAGVCGGLAAHAGMDVTLMRILVVLAVLLSGILPGVIVYIVMACIVPKEEV